MKFSKMFKYNLFLSINKFQYKIFDQFKNIIAYYKKYIILASNHYQAANKHS